MTRAIFALALITLLGIAITWQRVEVTRMGYAIQDMRSVRDELREERRQLNYQVSSLASPVRLMEIVRENPDNLVAPPPETYTARVLNAPAFRPSSGSAQRRAQAQGNLAMR